MARFTDKVVLITGGGSGLGRATAVRLAEEGARLALVDVSEAGLADTLAALPGGTEAHTVVADVSKDEDVDRYVTETVAKFGRIDGFFNNAGIEGKQNLTEDFTSAEFDRVVAINLRGVFLGLERVLKVMREQGSGYVVNTASVGGIRGIGNQSGYAAAKHGVVGLTRNSAIEYGQYGIRVNAIAPGAIWTPMVENSMKQLDPENPRKAAEEFIQVNPTKRYGEAHEIAAVVAFLLSDDASYINATVVPIDGGQSAKY
ncbi:NAD(P)-dependent dehydrogenase (short-subunit alcohol dehydrogenase family) [Microbacterium sp. ZKA21]|uniref:glucose 1-dehydrogenase n=1 Tax=Microbacterium sp. ZKA21 TaxID=3381694 RepID=UPI003D23FB50